MSWRSLIIIIVGVCAACFAMRHLAPVDAQEATPELGGAAPPPLEGPDVEGVSPAPAAPPEAPGETTSSEPVVGEEEGRKLTLWEMARAGGVVLIAITVLSMIALSLIIESFFSISINRLIPGWFVAELEQYVAKGDLEGVLRQCDENAGPLCNIVRTAVSGGETERRLEAVVATGELEGEALFHRASYLSIFGTIAPMLGLMGTVFGMIRAFNTVAFQAGLGKPQLLAKGISQALITTAAGLVVGIPTMFMYFYFRSRGNRILLAVESGTRALVEWRPDTPATKPQGNLFPMRLRVAMEEALGEAIIGLFFLGFILGPLAMRKGLRARKEAASTPQAVPSWKGAVAVALGAFDLVLHIGLLVFLVFNLAS